MFRIESVSTASLENVFKSSKEKLWFSHLCFKRLFSADATIYLFFEIKNAHKNIYIIALKSSY